MVIHTTRWAPDTCGCELEYEWDTDTPEDARVHTFKKVVKACEAHTPVVPKGARAIDASKEVYNAVLEENQRKNQALTKALEARPELADLVDGRTGKRYDLVTVAKQIKTPNPNKAAEALGASTVLKEGINYKWRWVEPQAKPKGRPARILEIDFDVPVTVEDIIAAKSSNPDASEKEIQMHAKRQLIGEPDILQQALDAEFTEEKGRGQVKVATATKTKTTTIGAV